MLLMVSEEKLKCQNILLLLQDSFGVPNKKKDIQVCMLRRTSLSEMKGNSNVKIVT